MLQLDEEFRVQSNGVDTRVTEVAWLVMQDARDLREGLDLPLFELAIFRISIDVPSTRFTRDKPYIIASSEVVCP